MYVRQEAFLSLDIEYKVYTSYMGLIGLIITLGLMVLGAGYFYFGMGPSSMTIENDAPAPVTSGLGLYENLKTEANDIKETEEERVEQEIAALEEGLVAGTPKNQTESLISGQAPKSEPTSGEAIAEKESLSITDRLMTTGFAVPNKTRTIDTVVLHSSYDPNGSDPYSVAEIVKIYESYGVSAHYLIDRQGKIYRLVEDKNIAYHAGASKMPDGRQDVNNFSIGIEIMNKEDTQFTKAQYEAVNTLVATLKQKHGIKYVIGHGDIAPTRKTDPWNFDWKKLK